MKEIEIVEFLFFNITSLSLTQTHTQTHTITYNQSGATQDRSCVECDEQCAACLVK